MLFQSSRSFVLLALLMLLLGNRLQAADWPQWNGPQRNGISSEVGFSKTWPDDGLPTVWTREIGTGFSSMSVVGQRLLAMGHTDGKETVWCLDSKTGEILWSHSYECELIPNLHEGGPCSTPTIDKDSVYTLGKEGQLFCLQLADGKVVWEKKLQDELGVKLPEWGFSSSALILDNQLILEAGRVVSFNKATGEKIWESETHTAGYGSAAPFQWNETTLLATLDCDALRVFDAISGKELASTEWKSPYETNATTPIVVDDKIFISTGYNIGCGLFQFNGTELTRIYKNEDMRNHFNNCVLLDGWLYGIDGNSHNGRNATLNCLNLQSGKLAWKQRGMGCGSLIAVDGKLIILAETGHLVLAEQSSEGFTELARSNFLTGRCWTAPILADRHLYGRNADGRLKCVVLP
jgi:outer membrane protein assembly factor BamB